MGRGVNKQTLIGNVGTDPEVRFTANGLAVCTLRVACNEQKKVDDKWVDHVEWFSVVLWGKKAENAGAYNEIPLEMVIQGEFDGFYEFLLRVEQLPRITQIHTMKIFRNKNLTKITKVAEIIQKKI